MSDKYGYEDDYRQRQQERREVVPDKAPHQMARDHHMPPHNNIGMALQAHAWAQVQSRYVMAQARPRLVAHCRQRMIDECKEFRFATEAVYAKPVGKEKKQGLGIRFAEAAMQCWTNLLCETTSISEDSDTRTMRTTVTDLESNTSYSVDSIIEKFVLKKKPPKLPGGQVATVHSYNNYGEAQYKCQASEDDLVIKQNATVSKVVRNLILKHIPRWVQDDCKRELHRTMSQGASRGDRKIVHHIVDEFAEVKVTARQLADFLGVEPELATGYQVAALKSLLYSLKEGQISWKDAVRMNQEEQDRESRQERQQPQDSQPAAEATPRRRGRPARQTAQNQAEQGRNGRHLGPQTEEEEPPRWSPGQPPQSPPPHDHEGASDPSDGPMPPDLDDLTSLDAPLPPADDEDDAPPAMSRTQRLAQQVRGRHTRSNSGR